MGGSSMSFELPYPPTVNTYYRKWQNKIVISDAGRRYRLLVANAVGICKPLEGRLHFAALVYPPDKRKRDLDNILKAMFDALCKANVFVDDSQIDSILLNRCESVRGGKVLVYISEALKSEDQQRKTGKVQTDSDLRGARSRKIDSRQSVSKPDIFKP
jgi:crossover junction endodeoxyribonuclease RusA